MKMRYLVLIFLIGFASLQYKLWFGEGSVREWIEVKHKTQQQVEANQQLESRNQRLIADIEELRTADQALEEDARQSLGMIKNDEVYFQVVERSQSHVKK
jgi:cell division protein FtsB